MKFCEVNAMAYTTLKRRIFTAYGIGKVGNQIGGPRLLESMAEFNSDPERLRVAVDILAREGVFTVEPFEPDGANPLAFMMYPGARYFEYNQSCKDSIAIGQEIVEWLAARVEVGERPNAGFRLLKEAFPDVSGGSLEMACRHLGKIGAVKATEAENGIYMVKLLENVASGRPQGGSSVNHYHHTDNSINLSGHQNALNMNSPHASVQQTTTGLDMAQLTEIIASLRGVVAGLPRLELSAADEAKARTQLEAAAGLLEDKEPDPKLADSIVSKVLKWASEQGENATKLATVLSPVASQLGLLAGQYTL